MASNPVTQFLKDLKKAEADKLSRARSDFADINDQLTIGPDENNLSGAYTAGKGVWDLHFLDKISADVLLVMQSRMGQLYLKTNQPNQTSTIPRRVKDLLVKDFFPVHVVKDLG
jgi:hypothetical protein